MQALSHCTTVLSAAGLSQQTEAGRCIGYIEIILMHMRIHQHSGYPPTFQHHAGRSNNFYRSGKFAQHLHETVASFQQLIHAIQVCLYTNMCLLQACRNGCSLAYQCSYLQRIVHLQKVMHSDAAFSVKMLTRFGDIRKDIMRRPVVLRVGAGVKEQLAYNHHHDLQLALQRVKIADFHRGKEREREREVRHSTSKIILLPQKQHTM